MTHPLIYGQMAKIMAEVGAVAKAQFNSQQRYQFRGVDDVYQALQKIMASHGVFSLPTVLEDRTEERTTKSGTTLIYRVLKIKYTFYAEDGSNVEAIVIGEGMDSGDKGSNKAMSVADKYCLLQAFKVPTSDAKDPENDSDHDREGLAPKRQAASVEPIDDIFTWKNPSHTERLREACHSLGLSGLSRTQFVRMANDFTEARVLLGELKVEIQSYKEAGRLNQ